MEQRLFRIMMRPLAPETDAGPVREKLAALFHAQPAQIDALLERAPVVIKRGLTEAQALQYQRALTSAGVGCALEAETPPAPSRATRICPKCQTTQPQANAACVRCGIIFAKYVPPDVDAQIVRPAPRVRSTVTPPAEPEIEIFPIEREGWLSLGIGLAITVAMLFMPFLSFIFSYLKVLVHEFGHSVCGWLFGYPSVPAFDFMYGGGVAIHQERNMFVLLAVYAGFGALFVTFRRNRATLLVLAGIVAAYSVCAFTPLHEIIILLMGHGAELLFAAIFLYRAMSGRQVVVAVERPLYGFVGSFIWLLDVRFAFQLVTDYGARVDYEEAKGGGHWMDFSRVAEEFLHVDLRIVAFLFLVVSLLTPIVTWLFYRYQNYLFAVVRPFFQTGSDEDEEA